MPMLEHKKRFMNLIQLQLDFNKVYWEIQYNNSKQKVTRLPDLLFFVTYTDFFLSCSLWVPGSFSIYCTLTLGMTMLAGGIKWLAMRFLCIIHSWCPEATLHHLGSCPWKLFGKGQVLSINQNHMQESKTYECMSECYFLCLCYCFSSGTISAAVGQFFVLMHPTTCCSFSALHPLCYFVAFVYAWPRDVWVVSWDRMCGTPTVEPRHCSSKKEKSEY